MNMDIKDIIAKLKAKSGGGSRNSGGVAAFFEKNPKMKIIIPAIFLAISLLVSVIIIIKTGKTKIPDVPVDSSGASQNQVEVLPEEIREAEKLDGINDAAVFNQAVLAHPKVTAIIYNNEGYYTATVETDNAHYPNLSVGQYVAGSDWLVESITADRVVFSCNGQEITVTY